MNIPKPQAPVVARENQEALVFTPSPEIVDAMKSQLKEIRDAQKPKKTSKPKGPFIPKNRPLQGHEGLMALKKELEQR